MTRTPSSPAIQGFCETVYAGAEDGWLVLSYPDPLVLKPDGTPVMKSDWFDVARTPWQALASAAARRARTANVYFGVVLQQPDCAPGQFKRSRSASAYSVPGLWFDLDLAYGHHAASTLPQTDDEALRFLEDLPAKPSLIIHSGGGLYGWWLFEEPYVITSEQDRDTIAHLSKEFTYTLVEAGKLHGWTLDALGDLARVLRPPGTINFKYDKLVEVLHDSGQRYNPSDFDWLLPLPQPARTEHQGQGIGGQPDLVAVVEHYGATLERKSTTELMGAHPQHGSSTGSNLSVNTGKGLWHCWRHSTGGDALALIAVCEDLLPCEQACAGAIRGDLFRRVVGIANTTFQAGIALGATAPHAQHNGHAAGTAPEAKGLLIDMETVERKPVDWIWEPYLARGKLCMLDGDPGVGKTLLAIQLAANLSKEFPFPDQHGKLTLETGPPAPTLFVAMEDDLADTVKMRLEDAGADCALIKVLNEVEEPDGRTHQVTLDDIPAIERILQDLRPLLVVIDSIQSVLGGRVDIHRANQVDEKLTQLARLAQRYHCAIVCIRHPSKPGQSLAKLMHRGLGSVAFIGKARLGLFVEEHPTDRSLVLLVQSKSNAGMPARTQLFSKREGLFSWAGVTRLTSQDLAGSGPGPDPTAMLGAYLWLEHRLDGNLAWPSADISAEGEEEGFSKKVLFVASKRLGIIKKQITEGWTWRLPPLSALSPPTPTTTGVSGETGETGVSG